MHNLHNKAKFFICLVVLAGLGTMAGGMLRWDCTDVLRFVSFLVVASLASRLKVSLPGVTGNMSMNLPFLLIAIAELSLGEAVVIAAASTLVQCLPSGGRRLRPVQVLFNTSTLVLAVGAGAFAFQRGASMSSALAESLLTVVAGVAFLIANTAPVAGVIAMSEGKSVLKVWNEIFSLTFPYFGLGAAIAALTVAASHYIGWQTPLFIIPVMVLAYRSFKRLFTATLPEPLRMRSAAAAD